MNTQEIGSQFLGTPWKNDQEIYDFASERHDVMGWDWTRVKADLVANGLNAAYADAIIENLKVVEKEETGNDNKRKYISWGLSILFAFIAYLILRPLAYSMSPEYGRYIIIAMIAVGLSFIRKYREGK